MWHKEEIKLTINDLALLNEALVDVGALRRVIDESLAVLVRLLEESLSHTLVDNDEGDLGRVVLTLLALEEPILLLDDLVQLLKLKVDNLLAHGVAHAVTVDENVVGHLAIVELAVALERPHEVVGQNRGRDDLLAFLGLRGRLSVVLAPPKMLHLYFHSCSQCLQSAYPVDLEKNFEIL